MTFSLQNWRKAKALKVDLIENGPNLSTNPSAALSGGDCSIETMIVIGSSNFVISPTQVFSFDIHVREKYLFGGYLKHKLWAWLVWGQIKMNECRNGTFRSADVDSKRRGRVGRWRLLLVCGVETTSVVGFTHQPPFPCSVAVSCGFCAAAAAAGDIWLRDWFEHWKSIGDRDGAWV